MPIKKIINIAVGLVWLINGLFCKVLGFVPRHQQIVARILGAEHAAIITKAIGISEILMAVWIWSRIKPKVCAVTQVLVIAVMNTLEFILAPDLLLFGRVNAIIAVLFIAVILLNEYYTVLPAKAKQ